ncbi:BTB/POZ domain-containing protein [Ditylenchus destructor]|nr:BTB/POZ domain-containing protein [Ditylenchus destructor]
MSSSESCSEWPPEIKRMRNGSDSNSDFDGESDYRLAKDYSKYVIVAENEFKTPGERGKSTEVAFHNAHWKIFATNYQNNLNYQSHSSSPYERSSPYRAKLDIRVCCNYIFSTKPDFHAEILFIDGTRLGLKIRKKFKIGTTTPHYYATERITSVVIRIFEEKKHFVEKLSDQWAPDVTFVVNGEKCEANRQYLANASPVFRKMLFEKFAEAKQSEIVLEGIGSADDFNDFLLAISPFGVQPNPTNVLFLLKLAHQYDIPNLMRMCEERLKFCDEIPIADRIFLAQEYELSDLKAHTAHVMTDKCLKKMWKEHKEKLLKPEFLYLLDIHMDRLK